MEQIVDNKINRIIKLRLEIERGEKFLDDVVKIPINSLEGDCRDGYGFIFNSKVIKTTKFEILGLIHNKVKVNNYSIKLPPFSYNKVIDMVRADVNEKKNELRELLGVETL